MTIEQETAIYDRAHVNSDTGEIQEFDSVLFNEVVRRAELEFISSTLREKPALRILDLGCGGGWLTRILARMGHDVLGIDVSRGLLEVASEAAEIKGRLIHGDGHNLPFRAGTFDAVVCVGALHHTDLSMLLPRLARVMEANGTLIFLEPNRLNPFSEVGRRLFPMSTHTPGERPYGPSQLKEKLSKGGWDAQQYRTRFVYAFALSYVLRRTGADRLARKLVGLVDRHEKNLTRWLSLLPIGAVILGTAKVRANVGNEGGRSA